MMLCYILTIKTTSEFNLSTKKTSLLLVYPSIKLLMRSFTLMHRNQAKRIRAKSRNRKTTKWNQLKKIGLEEADTKY